MSCSDKILKWNTVGIQGSLISSEKVTLDSIVVECQNNQSEFNQSVVERGLVSRCQKLATRVVLVEPGLR